MEGGDASAIAGAIVHSTTSWEHPWAICAKIPQEDDALEGNLNELDSKGEQVEGVRVDPEQDITEDVNDHESLDSEEMKSSIYRFLRKLERHDIACRIVISELVSLVRSSARLDIRVTAVPISITRSTPAKKHAARVSFA